MKRHWFARLAEQTVLGVAHRLSAPVIESLEHQLRVARGQAGEAREQAGWATSHLGKVWAALTGGNERQTLAPEDVLAAAVRVKQEAAERDEWAAKACDDQGALWADRYDAEHAVAQDLASRLEQAVAQCDTERARAKAAEKDAHEWMTLASGEGVGTPTDADRERVQLRVELLRSRFYDRGVREGERRGEERARAAAAAHPTKGAG